MFQVRRLVLTLFFVNGGDGDERVDDDEFVDATDENDDLHDSD